MNGDAVIVTSIQVGLPRELGDPASADPFEGPWLSGIFKEPVSRPVYVGSAGIDGDGQADLTVHGGPDKALCVYSSDHYPVWRQTPVLASMGAGAFGENLTVAGVAEDGICIGDVWLLGDVVLQVSQPRQPCWKLARKWGIRDFTARVVETNRTGWYFRVLSEGWIAPGTPLELSARPSPEWTVTAANRVMHTRPFDRPASARLAALDSLSTSWRTTLGRR